MRSVVWVSYGKSKTFSIFDIHIKSSWLRRIKTHKAPLRKVAKRVKNKSGLKEMTIAELEKMWEELEVIPINNNDEIESDFFSRWPGRLGHGLIYFSPPSQRHEGFAVVGPGCAVQDFSPCRIFRAPRKNQVMSLALSPSAPSRPCRIFFSLSGAPGRCAGFSCPPKKSSHVRRETIQSPEDLP